MAAEGSGSSSTSQPKIKLYWLEKSRSQRILWLLEELKVPYEIETFKRTKQKLAPPELKAIHPLGKSPVVTIEAETTEKPLVLAESGCIIEYLIHHFGTWLVPKRYREGQEGKVGGEREEWLRDRFFLHYAEGSMMTYLVTSLLVSSIRNSPVPFFIRPITNGVAGKIESMFLEPNFKTHFEFLEGQMATSPDEGAYLCGKEMTGADIIMSFPLEASRGRAGLTPDKYPKLCEYIDRIQARPAYKRAVQKIIDVEGSYSPLL
ncbi:MAG: hypothetical protein M1817_002395 [Caeruleum heppii]|nr:MAG: hypothetical protein M1817_002395 [Caeruleum heppii]